MGREIFCLTGIPMILGLIEAFLMSGRVARFNEIAAQDVALRVKALTTGSTADAAPVR